MSDPRLINADLAPTRPEQRTWNKWHIAALWVGMAICIPTYKMGSDLIAGGYSLGLALAAIVLGNLIILVPLVLNAHPGTRYGIPFPVLLRASFGVFGCNIPALMRALVACGWFGIQTWIGGSAIYTLLLSASPDTSLPSFLPAGFGITTGQFLCFVAFWLLNVALIVRGMNAIKWLETYAAPFLLLLGVALFVWAWSQVGSLGRMLESASAPTQSGILALGAGITAAASFWGTLALNIPDFARFAKTQRDQIVGQAIGLPATMALFSFIGAVVTNATVIIFGSRIADPDVLAAQIGGPGLTAVALIGLAVATLSTNLAANVVSPANDFSNVAPSKIDFRKGALITAGIGFVMMPWKLLASAGAYLFVWLIGYGAMLGAVGGIMITDYYLLRRKHLDVDDLYRRGGQYEYRRGFNPVALVALAAGIAPNVPGFLGALNVIEPGELWGGIYNWAWFVSFFVAGCVYYLGTKLTSPQVAAGQAAVKQAA